MERCVLASWRRQNNKPRRRWKQPVASAACSVPLRTKLVAAKSQKPDYGPRGHVGLSLSPASLQRAAR
jgi:hypothetical protein